LRAIQSTCHRKLFQGLNNSLHNRSHYYERFLFLFVQR
jgi:hypothetical protein